MFTMVVVGAREGAAGWVGVGLVGVVGLVGIVGAAAGGL
jgi:hypothetical protein